MVLLDSSDIHKHESQCLLGNTLIFSGPAGLGLAASLHCLQQLHLQQPAQSGLTAQDQVSLLGEHGPCGLGHMMDATQD